MVDRTCASCGAAFTTRKLSSRFCSRRCYHDWRTAVGTLERTCQRCGATFQAKRSLVECGDGRFCSTSCGRSAYLARTTTQVELACETCGATFTRCPSHARDGKGRYCSVTCRNEGMSARGASRYRTSSSAGHPLADPTGRVASHRRVLYDMIGPGTHPCHWCRKPVTWAVGARTERGVLVVDHVDNNGRNNAPENLVPSCHRCNCTRSPQPNAVQDDELFVTNRQGRRLRAVEAICPACGEGFLRPKNQKQTYCSRACSNTRRSVENRPVS